MTSHARWCLPLLLLALLLPGPGRALADEGPPPPEEAAPGDEAIPPAAPLLGLITGDRVNVRVGPRLDNRPVTQLEEGAVVLVVEEVPGWLGVRIPAGFSVAVATRYTEPDGPDAVRVTVGNLNVRVHPPEEGRPAPGIFRDRPERGALLPLVERVATESAGEWAWVLAPEGIRAYVSDRYVKVLGPAEEHADLLEAARARRRERIEQLARARREALAEATGMRVRETLSAVQAELADLRRAGGFDKAPVVALANRLDEVLQGAAHAPVRVLTLARALREDLEREIVLRVARYDAALAAAQGRTPAEVPPLEPTVENVAVVGEIRFEPTPGWREPGIFILWVAEVPTYVLRLTTGGELPHPDFGAHADAGPRRVRGGRPGERLFGLPVLDVRSIREMEDPGPER